MRIMSWLLRASVLASVSAAGNAAVIVNPLAPVSVGIRASIANFATLPASSSSGSKALAQQLKPIRDGSGRLMINDTRGILYRTDTRGSTPTAWFDIRTQNVGFSNTVDPTQTGLMSFAFHPNFGVDPTRPGYSTFYTFDTTAPTGTAKWGVPGAPVNHENVVREWTVADPHAATAIVLDQREVMRIAQPYGDHGPGTIAFNTAAAEDSADYGKLYVGLGDGGSANDPLDSAQSLTSPFGKILRIDPADPDGAGPKSYAIPADNPFVATDNARGEIWAYGLRNPQNFSFDGTTGTMLIADIGQAQIEEVNLGIAGANYGWPLREGTFARGTDKRDTNIYDSPANDGRFLDPIAQYDHEEIFRDGHGLAGIGGAYLYTGSLIPELVGQVILDDLVTGRIFYFSLADAERGTPATLSELLLSFDGAPTTMLALAGTSDNAFGRTDTRMGVDADGELYFVTKRDGTIFRLTGAVPEPSTWMMMLFGFAVLGGVLRRRRGLVPSAARI